MSMSLPPSIGTGHSSNPGSSDYMPQNTPDNIQEVNNTKIQQGHLWNKGVILAKDSLEVPLEIAFGIQSDRSESSKPSLLPLFRTRYVEDHGGEDLSRGFYVELRGSLSPDLQAKLSQNDDLPLDEKDADIVALDNSLRFEAGVMALSAGMGTPAATPETVQIGIEQFQAFPQAVNQQILNYGTSVSQLVESELSKIGPNDPSYDILLSASNNMKDALQLLNPTLTPPAA